MAQVTASTASWPTLATSLPGPETMSALADVDAALLTPAHLLDAITCTERLQSHLAGLQISLLTEFAKPGRAGDITRIVETLTDLGSAAHTTNGTLDPDLLHALVTDHAHGMAAAEVAAALHISPITARGRVERAIDLHDGLPATHLALTQGLIDRGRAAVIAEQTDILDPETRSQVEDIVLPLAHGRTAGRLRPLVDRAVIIADPGAAERRVKRALTGREVTHRPLKDQLSLIKAILPADGAVTVFTLIDLLAGRKAKGDDRLIGERRADALSDLCKQLLTHGLVDLRGIIAAGDDQDDPDEFGDLLNDDEPDIDDAEDDFGDPADNPNGPVASNCDWYDDDVDTGTATGMIDGENSANTDPTPASEAAVNANTARAAAGAGVSADSDDTGALPATEGVAEPPATVDAAPGTDLGANGPNEAPVLAAADPTNRATTPSPKPDSQRLLRRQGRRPHLTLTMSLSTLVALDRMPGHLDGYGAVTAELAEAIMDCAASLNLVIIDPTTGHPLHASGREYYRPRQHHRDIAVTMAETCRFPSCRQPVWKCDLDHRKAYDHQNPELGGQTDPCNLDPLCRRHHLMKHHSDWSPQRQPDGTMKWTSPTNHTHIDPPREITLPGELLMPTPSPRTSIGSADEEHHSRCTATSTDTFDQPGVLSRSYAIRLANREELHQRVLQRLANLRRRDIAEMSGGNSGSARKGAGCTNRPNDRNPDCDCSGDDHSGTRSSNVNSTSDWVDFDDHPAWTTANIP